MPLPLTVALSPHAGRGDEMFALKARLHCWPHAETWRYGIILRQDLNAIDAGRRWARPTSRDDLIDDVGRARNNSFHAAVAAIAHPAIEAERRGIALDEDAIADALHAPFDPEPYGALSAHGISISSRRPCRPCAGRKRR